MVQDNTVDNAVGKESNLIVKYHAQGCNNNEILSFLKSYHGLTISLSKIIETWIEEKISMQ